ncbi:MAG: hypothetical protein E6Q95_03200 [Chitinophagaceae bacterium]|nr:MAG: hypothetical protein E6Q95_03200 [Chitinophagaceae bacterium]
MAAIYIKKDKDGSIEALVKVNTYKDVTNIENRAKTVEVFSLASKLVKEKITNGVYVGYAVLSDGESTVGSTVNRSAGGYDCETIVSYRKKSSWSDCDGSHTGGCYGHITLTTIKESRTKCYVSLGGNQEQIDWIEDDNFGMPYEEYEEEVVEEKVVKKDPCAEAKKNDSIAMTLLKNLLVKGKKDSIMASVASDTVEKSFTFGKDASGTIRTTNIAKGTRLQSAPMSPTNSNFIVQGAGHSHTKDGYAALSPGDIYSFNTANRANGQFRYFFGFASSGDTYLFTIIDSTVFADFVAKYPMNSVFDIKDQGWLENSDIGQDYNMIFDACIRQGYTKDAADEAAQAYVIKEFKMGIALSKSDANGNFKGVFYDTKPTGMVTQPYTIAKATNCNY